MSSSVNTVDENMAFINSCVKQSLFVVTRVNFLHPSFIHLPEDLSRIKVFLFIDSSDHAVECLETKVDGKLAELFQQGLECKNINVY